MQRSTISSFADSAALDARFLRAFEIRFFDQRIGNRYPCILASPFILILARAGLLAEAAQLAHTVRYLGIAQMFGPRGLLGVCGCTSPRRARPDR